MLYFSDDKFQSDDQFVRAYLNLIAAGDNIINVHFTEKGKKNLCPMTRPFSPSLAVRSVGGFFLITGMIGKALPLELYTNRGPYRIE